LILAEAPLSAFKFAPASDFSIVALIKDETEQVVQKLSQHYALTDAAKGNVLFYREAQLTPGKYHVQVIAYDAAGSDVKVNTTPLEIPKVDETKPRLSSVAMLKRAERLSPEEQKRDQPLRLGELLVYPNLGERLDRSTTKQLAYFFTAWPSKGATKPLQMTLEILQNNHSLGTTSGELPAADQSGQIKYAGSFAIDKLQPGLFELRITVGDGSNKTTRSTTFVIGS